MGELKLIIKPDEDEVEAAEVHVDGTIDGRVYRFLLDTGAARSSVVLDDHTAAFSSVGKHDSSGVFAPSSDDLITVPRIEVGPISRQDFTLTRAAAPVPGITNLIGMDLLKDFRCHFLFDTQRVLMNTDDIPEDAFAFEPLCLDQKAHPYVDVHFEAQVANAVWDTGASITVVDISFINAHPAFFAQAGQSMGTDSAGTTMETPMFNMSGAVIGTHVFPPHRVAGVDLSRVNATIAVPMDLILGYNTVNKANWLFDFPGRKWAITKWLDVQ